MTSAKSGRDGGETAASIPSNSILKQLERRQRTFRVLFWCYAALLFVGTHWPALKFSVPVVERPDLFVHCAIFGCWCLLFWLTAYAGPIARIRSILIAVFVAAGYAAIDERLQAVPWVQRNCAWDDLEANWLGIGLAGAFAIIFTRVALLVRTSRRDTLPQ